MQTQQFPLIKSKKHPELFFLLLNSSLQQHRMFTFIDQWLEEQAIQSRLSDKSFKYSLIWLQAKPIFSEPNSSSAPQYQYDNEFLLIYHDAISFHQDYKSGELIHQFQSLRQFVNKKKQENRDYKVIILFHSVSDSLQDITLQEFMRLLLEITITYEFDYIQLYDNFEVLDFLKEVHDSIIIKQHRKELSMYSRKGFRPGKKAQLCGFKDPLSITYISFLMCIPGVSENKAIGLAKIFPTLKSLMEFIMGKGSEKEKKERLREIEVQLTIGDKSKKLGKVIANKIYTMMMAVDPSLVI